MAAVAERVPAKVIRVEVPYGRIVDPEDVLRAGKGRKIKFVGLTHGETSTGVVSRLEDYRKVADALGALLIVGLIIIGSLLIMANMNHNMMPTDMMHM